MQKSKIVLLGAGNLATRLAMQLFDAGFYISQIYNRTEGNAKLLAGKVQAKYTYSFAEIEKDANLYICALKDDALPLAAKFLAGVKGTVVHTAGSVDMSIFEGKVEKYGVFYPLQTFSKNRKIDFSQIPIFIEANSVDTLTHLKIIASILSEKVYEIDSERRKMLHLSAVFACNFVNHMYVLADEIAEKAGFNIKVLLPLINETMAKICEFKPIDAQTGPAVRFDKSIINDHLSLLEENDNYRLIYKMLTDSIHQVSGKN